MAPAWTVFVALAVCQTVWGGYAVIGKWVFSSSGVDPLVFALARVSLAAPILLCLAALLERGGAAAGAAAAGPAVGAAAAAAGGGLTPAAAATTGAFGLPARSDWRWFALLGALVAGNQLGYIIGVKLTTPTVSTIMQQTSPILTALLSTTLGLDAPLRLDTLRGQLRVTGLAAAVAGAVAVVALSSQHAGQHAGQHAASAGTNMALGVAFLVGNCICDSSYVLLQKWLNTRYPPVTTTAFAYTASTVWVLLAVLLTPDTTAHGRWALPASVHGVLLYTVFLNSVLVYSLHSWANKQTSPSTVTAFYPGQAVVAAVVSSLVLGTDVTQAELVAGTLVVAGLACTVYSSRL